MLFSEVVATLLLDRREAQSPSPTEENNSVSNVQNWTGTPPRCTHNSSPKQIPTSECSVLSKESFLGLFDLSTALCCFLLIDISCHRFLWKYRIKTWIFALYLNRSEDYKNGVCQDSIPSIGILVPSWSCHRFTPRTPTCEPAISP